MNVSIHYSTSVVMVSFVNSAQNLKWCVCVHTNIHVHMFMYIQCIQVW